MKIQQIRNATVKIEYSDQTFLVDPMLSKKETLAARILKIRTALFLGHNPR